jgi:IclR family pca regulon transcriptional regulator
MSIAAADYVAGLAKGLAVLECFDTDRQRLNATLAAQRAGLSRAAARRHLLTLAHLGYLETDGHYYWLSPKVLRLSGSYLASARESFSVTVLDEDAVVVVARSVPAASDTVGDVSSTSLGAPPLIRPLGRWMAHGLHLGARLPAHATSTGRVLLAALPKSEWSRWLERRIGAGGGLPRLTPHTVTDPRMLTRIVAQVRKADWCVCSEEHEWGVHAVAVPLRDMQGRVVAALNAVLSHSRFQLANIQRDLLPLLQAAALELRPQL